MIKPWCLGNTTVRSPFRLRNGLIALSSSPLQGNLRGKKNEIALRNLLGENEIVKLGNDKSNSVGRKWRSALNKLGFLYPEVPSSANCLQNDIGIIDMITPNGWRLIRAETVPAMQECFLRALAAHYIPSPLEQKFTFSTFSPLRHTLSIMLELEKKTKESCIHFIEMALFVQLTTSNDNLVKVVSEILGFRNRRSKANNKKLFDRESREGKATNCQCKAHTFHDYADTNFRYLKATGLVQSKGRGISLVPEKHVIIEKLIQDTCIPNSDLSYFTTLCNGAVLPTDNKDLALEVMNDLLQKIKERGISFDMTDKPIATSADIEIIRYEIEKILLEINEEEYANKQANNWKEIAAYMEIISQRSGKKTLSNGKKIEVPKEEAPAYFEWILWRAFLAINSLVNKPYKARRFNLDQDFLPVGTAPGNGPDLIFEFKEFVIVVEVTLTDNSRQEAVEGEPVRRHVADLVSQYEGKPVYGLFIANRIDSNTAETFRIGVWYTRDDTKMQLNIIPVTLEQFQLFFESMFMSNRVEVALIRQLMDQCVSIRASHEAPSWKQEIQKTIIGYIKNLSKYPLEQSVSKI